jgi:serine/threonine protein phosphatase 1
MDILKFPLNTAGRDFFVGDIHGSFHLLDEALDRVEFNPLVDRVFSVGDLVDRGRESIRAIDWITHPAFHTVLGNHELMAMQYTGLESVPRYVGRITEYEYSYHGGDWLLDETQVRRVEVATIFQKLPIAIEVETVVGRVGVIHAEVPNGTWTHTDSIARDSPAATAALWGRGKIKSGDYSVVSNIDYVVVGHTIVNVPVMLGNVCYIDTGAVYSYMPNSPHYSKDRTLTLVEAKDLPAIPSASSLDQSKISYGY